MTINYRYGMLVLAMLLAEPLAHAGNDLRATFTFAATQADFNSYFPTYLANGYFSTNTSVRGTDANPAYVVGFMDYAADDISRPAVIPSWSEIDYFNGASWLNTAAVTPQAFVGYRQTLDMYDGTLSTSYRWVDGARSSQVEVVTFVSQDAPHLAASQIAITPDSLSRLINTYVFNDASSPFRDLQITIEGRTYIAEPRPEDQQTIEQLETYIHS